MSGSFFFQAEDGIRDLTVTGVQTCALPLLGFLFNFLLGRRLRLSERTISIIACGVILGSMLLTIGAFYEYHWNYNPSNEDKPFITSQDNAGFPHSFTWLPGGMAHKSQG